MLLALDTSGPTLSVGLFEGPVGDVRKISSHIEEIGRGHAERLMPTIRDVLGDIAPADLATIAVVVGPGSFMGLRVGIAAARALALGGGAKAVGVSRMQALAHGRGPVHVVLDARRGEVFEQAFDAANEPLGELHATPLAHFRPCGLPLVGSGAALVGAEPVSASDIPSLSAVAALAIARPQPARPQYGRGADARVQQSPTFAREAQR